MFYLYIILLYIDWYIYNLKTSRYEIAENNLTIGEILLNAINKQVEELKQEMVK